ncbi:hypothetical protein J6590_032855 [Homalodisca vitripennis]|nr:hypothetical protein J6590_032855 [Homalodisca vitripennis]
MSNSQEDLDLVFVWSTPHDLDIDHHLCLFTWSHTFRQAVIFNISVLSYDLCADCSDVASFQLVETGNWIASRDSCKCNARDAGGAAPHHAPLTYKPGDLP